MHLNLGFSCLLSTGRSLGKGESSDKIGKVGGSPQWAGQSETVQKEEFANQQKKGKTLQQMPGGEPGGRGSHGALLHLGTTSGLGTEAANQPTRERGPAPSTSLVRQGKWQVLESHAEL